MAINPAKYILESKAELAKVEWPSRTHTIKMSLVVVGISVLVGAYIAGIDAILAKLTEMFLIKK